MTLPTSAERHRRAREWLDVETSDADFDARFAAAKERLDGECADDADALLAVGEFGAIRRMLGVISAPERLLVLLGQYFAASGDDGTARRLWQRARDSFALAADLVDAQALRALAYTAESIGDRTIAADALRLAGTRPQPPAAWPDELTAFVYGTLGYAPDAARGRLRLRPELPREWTAASVQNIHVADALVGLRCARSAGWRRYEVEQFAGAIPVTLIFEGLLDAPLESASVDGRPADLNTRVAASQVIAPVQIVLDAPRVLEFEVRE